MQSVLVKDIFGEKKQTPSSNRISSIQEEQETQEATWEHRISNSVSCIDTWTKCVFK